MPVDQLIAWPKASVPTQLAAKVLNCKPYALNINAKAGKLPFEFFFSGNRLHISKASLLKYLGYNVDGTVRTT